MSIAFPNLPSVTFGMSGEPVRSKGIAELRDVLLMAKEPPKTNVDIEAWDLAIKQHTDQAAKAARQGHGFEFKLKSSLIMDDMIEAYRGTGVGVPYPASTPIFIAGFLPEPTLFVCIGDELTGCLKRIISYRLRMTGPDEESLAVNGVVQVRKNEVGDDVPVMPIEFPLRPSVRSGVLAQFDAAHALLCTIADSRHPVTRNSAQAKLNRARDKAGKPAIPPSWAVDYVTRLSSPNGGIVTDLGIGTHASPRPHDRRGHQRRLSSGKVTWVRDCRVNETLRHMTRDRIYYEMNSTLPSLSSGI